MRDQSHADHFFRELRGLVGVFRQLHAAAFSAAAGVNLRFHHHPPAQLLGRLTGIVGVVDDDSAWNWNSVSAQNVFCLILVDLHRARRFITVMNHHRDHRAHSDVSMISVPSVVIEQLA